MDERLKKKLELLGEPTLPARLTAEELFRRMDSGELVLPEEGPLSQTEDDSDRKVIPWIMVLRRGLPIAACLALVALLSRTGLWDKGFSSGANLSVTSEAPQWAADQTAPAVDDAPAESYRFDADFDANEEMPDPAPRSIAAENSAEEASDEEADAPSAAPDLARQDGTLIGSPIFDADDSANDSFVSDERPDTGGYLPPSDTTDNSGFNPDCGAGGDDPETTNPDTGGGDWEDDPVVARLWELLMELVDKLFKEEEGLAGLVPEVTGFASSGKFYGPIEYIEIYVRCHNNETEERFFIYIYCHADWDEEEQKHTVVYEDWGYPPPPDPDDGGGEPNPDTSGTSPDDEWDPDPGTGGGTDYGKNPDVGEESQEGSAADGEQERSEEDSGTDQEEAQEQTDTDQDQEEPQGDASLQPFPPHDPESD